MATKNAKKEDNTSSCKYAKLLAQSKEERTAAEIEFRTKSSRLSLESVITSTQYEQARAEQEVETLKGNFPLNYQAIRTAGNNAKELAAEVESLQELYAELFG